MLFPSQLFLRSILELTIDTPDWGQLTENMNQDEPRSPNAVAEELSEKATISAEPPTDENAANLSKNELKRRRKAEEKQRKAEEKAAMKAALAAEKAANESESERKSGSAASLAGGSAFGDRGENLDPTQYFANRNLALSSLRDRGVDPYPHKFHVTMKIPDFVEKFASSSGDGERDESVVVNLAGRVYSQREAGAKLVFYDLRGDGARVQIIADARLGGDSFFQDHSVFRRGDIVGVTGFPGKSRRGEFSIFSTKMVLLSSCLHMLPKHGLTDVEIRSRQRYLDLIVNSDVRETFVKRSRIIKFVREFLDRHDFLEVETPMMHAVAGGATAKPFVTHHNALHTDMYMRVAPELSLKMLVVGGLDRVYEIGKNFRNEGIDLTHNPEFTACEFYAAYWDYNDLIDFTEKLFSELVSKLVGGLKVSYHPEGRVDSNGNPGRSAEIDFTPPYRRISMVSELQTKLRSVLRDPNLTFPENIGSEESRLYLENLLAKLPHVTCEEPRTVARLLDALVGELIEPECINPTFICDHPQIMSPLAKSHRDLPHMTERFELFVNGKELCNAYTELNDPAVQRERFRVSQQDTDEGDDEAMVHDEDFCVALEHGLPPTAGWGLGIDRLTMLLTDNNSIKEVLLFPALKPKDDVPSSST